MDKPQGFKLMKRYFLFFLFFLSCNENEIIYWENYDETNELIENSEVYKNFYEKQISKH